MTIRFGVRIPFGGPASSPEHLATAAREAERLGFDAVLANDHLHKTFERHPQNPMASGSIFEPGNTRDPVLFETMTTFAYLAAITERINFVTAVTPLPMREPIIFAKQVSTADALAGGRIILGVGIANKTDKDEFDALGAKYLSYPERYRQAGEYVAAMREIWNQPVADFHGEHVGFDGLIMYPKPPRPVPIWLGCGTVAGGLERPAVRFALDYADGVIPPAVTSPDALREMIGEFTALAQASGRSMDGFQWCAQRRVSIGRTKAEAESHIDWMVREQAEMWKYVGHLYDKRKEGTNLSHTMATVGTADEIAANLRRYVAAGVTYFAMAFTYPTFDVLLDQLELFATEVIPQVRALEPGAALEATSA